MKRSFGLVVLSAAVLVVGGCSSGTGTTSSSTTASSAVAASSVVAPIELDTQTVAWFGTLCTGLARSIQSLDPAGSGLSDPSLSQATIVGGVQAAGASFGATAASLVTIPPPTFEGGTDLASTVMTGLNAAATAFPQSAATFAALELSDPAGMAAAKKTLQTELQTALATPLQAIDELPPGLRSAVGLIPACKALGA